MALAWGAVACSRASDEAKTHEWQSPLPPPPQPAAKEVPVPDGLSIALSIDGVTRPAITSEVLRTAKPDFSDPERRAWLIPTLVPEAVNGSVIEAGGVAGVSVKFQLPTPDGYAAVLFLTRRGDINVSAVDPKEPFPRFHGQGGRLHRPGDALPHAEKVSRLDVTRPATR